MIDRALKGCLRLRAGRARSRSASTAAAAVSYDQTLCLPKTTLPPRTDRAATSARYGRLCTHEHYAWQIKNRKGPLFVLHDGPPYANGSIHLGHVLNRVLKDIVCRHKSLTGRRVLYVPGWDCHGLPIEVKVFSAASKNDLAQLGPMQVRQRARALALEAVSVQKNALLSLSIMADWDNPYLTLNPDFELRQLRVFRGMLDRGLILRKFKPVYWSPSSRTALAEAELEYREHVSNSLYFKWPLLDPEGTLGFKEPVYLAIWTTTPWTLPANKAVAVGSDIRYCVYRSEQHGLVVFAESLMAEMVGVCGGGDVVATDIPGHKLTLLQYWNPLTKSHGPILAGSHVSDESGTGLVHTAPGHGHEDYELCKAYGIEPFCPIDDSGCYTREALDGSITGLFTFTQGNSRMLEMLQSGGWLLRNTKYTHQYPHDWRTKKPVMIRATAQWFSDLEPIKKDALEALKSVTFIPGRGYNRLESYVSNRGEWCISRQRAWGVPIPALYEADGTPVMNLETVDYIIKQFAIRGTDAWWDESIGWEAWTHPRYRNRGPLTLGRDTMDVWFDSGTSWASIEQLEEKEGAERGKHQPLADLYLEGSDQHRGWFQSSLLTYASTHGHYEVKAPYGTLLTHGFTLDARGVKMSKSLGNVTDPLDIIHEKSAKRPGGHEVLRYWVASSDFTRDVVFAPSILENCQKALQKIRATFRFLLGNLNGFDKQERIDADNVMMLDKIALKRIDSFQKEVFDAYEAYQFNRVIQAVNNFVNADLSAFYFNVTKDRLYADEYDSVSRRAALSVQLRAFQVLVMALAPILPMMTEEVWSHAKFAHAHDTSTALFHHEYPPLPTRDWSHLEEDDAVLFDARSLVTKALQMARDSSLIKSSLEATVEVQVEADSVVHKTLGAYQDELAGFFGVSGVCVSVSHEAASPSGPCAQEILGSMCNVVIQVSEAHKCPRCWLRTSPEADRLCERCTSVITASQSS